MIKLQIIVILTQEYRGAAQSVCNLKYSVPRKSPIAFHDASNYDYNLIIKECRKI